MISINRLYLYNYKLFTERELDFSNALLSIFDGPNGYGKTSIFDATELIITGRISRIVECDSINGSQSFDTIFFAKEKDKDVIFKAEFKDADDKYFVIGARVPFNTTKGRTINPKSIFDKIDFYLLPSYDIQADAWSDFSLNQKQIAQIRKDKFGLKNIDHFTLFNYIRQEDRLAYFNQTETTRSTIIEDLLGVEKARQKHKDAYQKYKDINELYNIINNEINTRNQNSCPEAESAQDSTSEYAILLDGQNEWDRENIYFGETNQDALLSQYNKELDKIEQYIKYSEFHRKYFAVNRFNKIPEEYRNFSLFALLLIQKYPTSLDDIELRYQNMIYLDQQIKLLDSQDYLSVDFKKLYKLLGVDFDGNIQAPLNQLKQLSDNQSNIQKVINNVLHIRDCLHSDIVKIYNTGVCPYCGHNWNTAEELEEKYISTKDLLQNLLDYEGNLYAKQESLIKEMIETSIYTQLSNTLIAYHHDVFIYLRSRFASKEQFFTALDNAKPMLDIIIKDLKHIDSHIINYSRYEYPFIKETETIDSIIIEKCIEIEHSIPADYILANIEYSFEDVYKRYSLSEEKIEKIRSEQISLKRQYIKAQYYKAFENQRIKIEELIKKRDKLNTIRNQLKEYVHALDKAIGLYKEQIIKEIGITFYFYSSRLLQSYHGGQGVLIKSIGGNIRFISPGSEHDVLYTMSSGQLSAVLLSFSLALNKIYVGNGLKTLLIDDPIQCMDDINMISLVELLRREFSESQIILSTHEDDFSDYLRYKFKKYNIDTQAITLKDA